MNGFKRFKFQLASTLATLVIVKQNAAMIRNKQSNGSKYIIIIILINRNNARSVCKTVTLGQDKL